MFAAAVFMEPSPGQYPGFHSLSFKKALPTTGRAPPPAQAGRQERTEGGRGLLVRVDKGGRAKKGGWGGGTGIELKTADERDCHSGLSHLLPAVVVITHSAHLMLKLSPTVYLLMNNTTVQQL